ncbi:MAG: hypothetical protein ABWY12_00110 [Burkholderiales bacterium]
MNVVQGKILDRTSKRGLGDLLVVLYDIDEEKRAFSDMGVEGQLISDDDQVEPQPVDPTTVVQNITLNQALRPDARTWLDFPGDRLGSVLTDRKGEFALTYSDEQFRLGEKERRPELVLIVLGPDHSMGVSVVSRLLHYSYVPRNNAGRMESYIIHIDPQPVQERDPQRLAGFFDRLKSPAGVEKRDKRRRLRNSIPRHLLPGVLAGNPRFVPPAAPAAELATAVQTAIREGMEWVRAAHVRPKTVRLDAAELAELDAAPDAPFRASACDVLKMKGVGTDLVRIRDLLSNVRAERTARGLDAEDEDGGEEDNCPETPVVEETSEAVNFIAGRVLGQIASLPAITREKSSGILDDLHDIKDRINQLEMSSGPANVTAFRDFHSLQMAFKDVWTAALDGALEEDVGNLYEAVNKLNEEYGEVFPNPDTIADLSQFEDMVATIGSDLMSEELHTDSVPENVQDAFPTLTLLEWNQLTRDGQNRLARGVNEVASYDLSTEAERRWELDELLREVMANPTYQTSIGRLQRLVLDVDAKLSRPYSFRYYKEHSVNYGILINYRQEWRPQNYQVGRLVSTLPLAPGESRELKVTHKVKMSRAEKEVRKSLAESSYESSSTVRSELDVLAKLSTDTNFKMTAQGSFSLGIGTIESSSEFSHNQQTESQRQHKQIAEATRKASEKVRQEREVSVEATTESELGTESSQKIHNPNNEVTVTYLMYELERRYHVSQTLNRVTPVILVALDMPSPHEITEGWILEHAWIIRRVLLDARFDDPIDWIEQGRQSEAVDIAVKRANYERELAALKNIEKDLDLVLAERRLIREESINLQQRKAEYEAGDKGAAGDVKDFFLSGGLSLFFDSPEPDKGAILQAAIDAAKSKLKYVEESAEQLTSLQRAAKRESREAGQLYSEALKTLAQKDTSVKQFQLHLRQNIFHYMHAIWETKHPDELFFQLVEQDVHHVGAGMVTCDFVPAASPEATIPGINLPPHRFEVRCDPPAIPDFSVPGALDALKVPLGRVAHVDQLLGFKGNYAIFPLKECSPLTDYMLQEFVDDFLGVRDPATELGVSSAELIEYSREVLRGGALSPEEVTALKAAVRQALSSPGHNTEEVILPTGQIYMEALKGEQVLLEDFKLAHRGVDLLKVQEEVREQRLDNLRRAYRLVGDTPDLSDADDADKKVVVEGNRSTIVDT